MAQANKKAQGEIKENAFIIVFGASGDLAKKMTFPSLFQLFKTGHLPDVKTTRIIGYARSDMSREKFEEQVVGGLDGEDEKKVEEFKGMATYIRGAYDEDEAFQNLEKELQKTADKDFGGKSHRVYYLAVPPSQFTSLAQKLSANNKPSSDGDSDKVLSSRLVIEKPFGKDLESSKKMMKDIKEAGWKEEEVYRVDHFNGLEVVKQLPYLLHTQPHPFSPYKLLNKENVQAVMIELKETFGCEGRGGYFDEFGIIRDVLQNHFIQVLTMLASDKPESLSGDSIRDEKVKVLKAIATFDPDNTDNYILGQYTKSKDGKKPGYIEDESVENKESKTATFAELVLKIDNERWKGVPWIMKSGKAIEEDIMRVIVLLKSPSDGPEASPVKDVKPATLTLELFETRKVYFTVNSRKPGFIGGPTRSRLMLDYDSEEVKKNGESLDPYAVVIGEALRGREENFVREDELMEAWRIFTPLLHHIESEKGPKPIKYEYGSEGPDGFKEFEKKLGYEAGCQ